MNPQAIKSLQLDLRKYPLMERQVFHKFEMLIPNKVTCHACCSSHKVNYFVFVFLAEKLVTPFFLVTTPVVYRQRLQLPPFLICLKMFLGATMTIFWRNHTKSRVVQKVLSATVDFLFALCQLHGGLTCALIYLSRALLAN